MSEQGKVHGSTFGKVPPELMHDQSITDGAVRLYAHMHWRYGQNQQNFEGQRSMAKYLSVSTTTIRKRIEELEGKDWVVTINREYNRKTGNFSTPFYHVFVSQPDCKDFRETYILQEGEVLYEQPTPLERKSRKGVGGKPSNLHRANSSSHGRDNSSYIGGANSSSDGHSNSSSHYPDSLYPDPIYPDSISKEKNAPNGAASLEFVKPIPSMKKPKWADEDCLIDVWAGIRRLDAIAMGADYHTKSDREKAKTMLEWPKPVTPDEIREVMKNTKHQAYPFAFIPKDVIELRAKKAISAPDAQTIVAPSMTPEEQAKFPKSYAEQQALLMRKDIAS